MNLHASGHPEWDDLNDLVDGRLEGHARERVELHLATCPECRARRAELSSLLHAASAAPPSIEPPADLWGAIRATIDRSPRRPVLVARGDERDAVVAHIAPRPVSRGVPSRRWMFAAAAALVVASSGITAFWMRSGTNRGVPSVAAAPDQAVDRLPALPASLARTEAAYRSDAEALRLLFEREREALSPATVTIVERSLATIDAAIAEARAALLADPANAELARFLDSNYRQKLELLRRATKLEVRS